MSPREIYEEFKRHCRDYYERTLDNGCKTMAFSKNNEITLIITYVPENSKYRASNLLWYTIKERGEEKEKAIVTDLSTLIYKYSSIFDSKNLKTPREIAIEKKSEELQNKR